MLRMFQNRSTAAARKYYTQGLAREDYYTVGQEIIGRWSGEGARLLGLSGDVDQNGFSRLCDNLHPVTGEKLTPRTKDNRTVGYDMNFHCPKGVSVLHALTGDDRIAEEFRKAVDQTMRELEQEMKTRVRRGGVNAERTTGNLVWGEFVHLTARPVNGVPDPHLHAHCFVFNATFDHEEGRWKAGQFRDLKRDAPYFQAAFHSRLSRAMAELGYRVERTAQGWDVAGIPREVIDRFSNRTAEIERIARDLGITDAERKGELGARSRKAKSLHERVEDLAAAWDKRLDSNERESLERIRGDADLKRSGRGPGAASPEVLETAFNRAIEHTYERASVTSDKRLVAEALRQSVGDVLPEQMWRHLGEAEGVLSREVDGQRLVTTREVLAEETAMLDFARQGRGSCDKLRPQEGEHGRGLSAQQRAAFDHLLDSRDRVMLLRGRAGTGKTTLMREVVRAIGDGGHEVHAFAPSAEASRGVLRSEGFDSADTVASLLQDPNAIGRVHGQVMWIDEAGQLGTRTLRRVFDLAERAGARVILSGDSRQHGAVERGDALRILETHAGCVPARVTQIRRQQGDYRRAIEALADGRVLDGFDRLDAMGAVVELGEESRYQTLARDYAEAEGERRSALVVSPTHAEGERVTDAIRAELRTRGRLDSADHTAGCLRELKWTESERSQADGYEPGLVVEFHQNAKGITKGERFEVLGRDDDGNVRLRAMEREREQDGNRPRNRKRSRGQGRQRAQELALPLELATRFQVYERREQSFAAGDLVRITKNGRTADGKHRLNNGARYRMKEVTGSGDVVLDNGWVIGSDFGHITHGYCITSHASQGKTVDQVMIAQSTASFAASSLEQFYVSASRARQDVRIYTDDKGDLRETIQRSEQRVSATELATGSLPGTKAREHAITLARLNTYRRLVGGVSDVPRPARERGRAPSPQRSRRLKRGR